MKPLDEPRGAAPWQMPSSTLRWWLEGRRDYPPVLRPEPTGSTDVTWGEFVEAGLLREYRDRDVPLQRLRPVIEILRERFDIPYPLAHFRPFVGVGRELLSDDETQIAERIDPTRSFGSPTLRGIRTDALAELVEAGEPPELVAEPGSAVLIV